MKETKVNVAVTGIAWMGSGVGSIESTLQKFFQEAQHEILLTVYTITDGADMLWDWLEIALSRGIEIKMIINRFDQQAPAVNAKLQQLTTTYPHFHLYDFSSNENVDLHAKVVTVDREKAIIGSSNLSRRGLLGNYELALTVEGQIAEQVASTVDKLIAKSVSVVVCST